MATIDFEICSLNKNFNSISICHLFSLYHNDAIITCLKPTKQSMVFSWQTCGVSPLKMTLHNSVYASSRSETFTPSPEFCDCFDQEDKEEVMF